MFLPLRDSPNEPGTPIVNWALIAINVAVFALLTVPLSTAAPDLSDPVARSFIFDAALAGIPNPGISAYDVFVYHHGFRPAEPALSALLSSMFLHGGFLHLAGNMLFLWIYGDNVEARLGHAGYLVAYLLCGVAATALHAVFDLSSNIPMVGASGAISGVLGFYFVFFPRNHVHVLFALFPFFYDVIALPARLVLGAYLVLDNLLPVLLQGGSGGVAHGAHIGGFLAGLGAAYVLGRGASETAARGRVIDVKPRPSAASARAGGDRARELSKAVSRGRYPAAAELWFSMDVVEAERVAPEDALRLGHWLAETGHPTAAVALFRRVLASGADRETTAWAHLGAGLVLARTPGSEAVGLQHLHDAYDLGRDGPVELQARAALAQFGSR